VRVCHIVESLDHGAVENWLVRSFEVARSIAADVDWTFCCILPRPGRLDDRVRALGGTVIHSPHELSSTAKFTASLRAQLRKLNFDVLHCHHDFLSAIYLVSSVGLPIKQRIVHVHNTDESLPVSPWKQRLLLKPFRSICLALADQIVGISNDTLDQFLRNRPRRPNRDSVLYYGVDLEPIRSARYEPAGFRKSINLPADAKVVLFLGRMAPLKNPLYVIDVLQELLKRVPNTYAVFAGTGELTSTVKNMATQLGIAERIRLLGWRDDAAYLMKNSDLFLFPRLESPREGLGLVVVESQAAGLPMLTTLGITADAIVNRRLVAQLPLDAGREAWAQQAQQMMNAPSKDFERALSCVEDSRFNMRDSVQELLKLY
jgi:glycosyltransferase involved in cell wall biosynthesis